MIKVTVEDVKPSSKKLHIEVSSEKVHNKREEILSRLKKSVNIKGFRKGKVPKNVIEQTYKKEIDEDVQKELAAEAYEFAIEDNKIKAISDPAFTDVEYDKDKPFKFDVSVDVHPEIELKEYKGIEITKQPIVVSDEDIDKTVKQILEAFAALKDKDSNPEEGDLVIIDIKTFAKETNYPIKDFTSENLYAELGKKQLLEEIEKEIYTMKPNETKKFEASFDNQYPLRALKGKNVIFEVTLKSLKTKEIPELNDEFAKKVNKEFNNVDDLLKDIKNRLAQNKEKEEIERQKDELLDKLLKEYDFDVPLSIVNQETNQMMVEYVKNMYYMGADINAEEYKPQNLRGKFENEAIKRVKSTFILLAVADKEGIDATNEEIKEVISKEADSRKKTFEELYKEYQEKNLIPIVQMDIIGDKALDFLHKNATIKEAANEGNKTNETEKENNK